MKTAAKDVTFSEFVAFIQNYPRPLEGDLYMDIVTYNDFTLGAWPLSVVASRSNIAGESGFRIHVRSEETRWIPIKDRVPTQADGIQIVGYGTNERLVLVKRSTGDRAHLCRWDADWFRTSEGHEWTHWLPLS